MLPVGTKASLFTAESTKGTVRLHDYIGKRPVVLIFYPMDDTPTCTKQLCAVRDALPDYAKYGAVVLGVNPGTAERHAKFAEKYGYDFPLVSDVDGTIRRMYGVKKMFGLFAQQRIVYIIDRAGRIAYARKGNRPTEELLSTLSAL